LLYASFAPSRLLAKLRSALHRLRKFELTPPICKPCIYFGMIVCLWQATWAEKASWISHRSMSSYHLTNCDDF